MSASSWRDDALCREADATLFFPAFKGEHLGEARKLCAACEVRDPCLTEALDQSEVYGFRGGMSGDERRKEIARRRREAVALLVDPELGAAS